MTNISNHLYVRVVCALLLVLALAGCTSELHHDLDEAGANVMIVALEEQGVVAEKEPDPNADARWMVTVSRDDKVRALKILSERGLPRPAAAGFDAHYPSGGLIPTSSEERILLQYSTAQELRGSLLAVDRVIDARVNLVLPDKPRVRLPNQPIVKPRASVLVHYRAKDLEQAPPLTIEQVRALVSGGVQDLDHDAVHVILTPRVSATSRAATPELAKLGPLAVSPSSKTPLKVTLAALIAVIAMLAGGLAVLLLRGRRA